MPLLPWNTTACRACANRARQRSAFRTVEKIPRKGGPAIARSDLLVINKADLATHVMADLETMERDTKMARGERPYVFTDLLRQKGLETVIAFIEKAGGLT